MAAETVGEGTNSSYKDFSNLGTNELLDLAVVTMKSMV